MIKDVPKIVVELGRAVELDGDTWKWTWSKKDNWIVTSNEGGNRLFLFKRPKKTSQNPEIKKGKKLYEIFNNRKTDEYLAGKVGKVKKKVGRANHVIYESDKYGKKRKYIHEFETPPIVWVDNPRKPAVIALIGGHIKITDRGIEG